MLEIRNLTKKYPDFSIEDFSINVVEGDYFMIIGVSGAGKSLLLELIAGLQKPDSGNIILNGKDITYQKIQNRKIGLLFQDYAIFPHLSVKDNIAYSLKLKKPGKHALETKIIEYAEKANAAHLLHRDPSTLSGGEIQRVALARTLAMKPECLLLDEPLSSLDVQLREDLRALLRKLNREGLTIIHITHDFEETISLAQHLAVIHDGKIVQQGTPKEVFQNPGNEFVAKMTGIKNYFKVSLLNRSSDGVAKAKVREGIELKIHSDHENCEGNILIRRRNIHLSNSKPEPGEENVFEGKITEIIPQKTGIDIIVDIGVELTSKISEKPFNELNLNIGKKIWVSFKPESVRFLPL